LDNQKPVTDTVTGFCVSLLLAEGHAVGALVHGGIGLVGTHQDLVQGAVVLALAVVGALLDGALDGSVGIAVHKKVPPFVWVQLYYEPDGCFLCAHVLSLIWNKIQNKRSTMTMAKIAPSILSADFANLEAAIHNLEQNNADWVHVDVMDGIFVPNISIGIPVVKALRPVTDLPLDVHLMIDRPIRYIGKFCQAGADWLTIHLESDTEDNTHTALRLIRSLGVHPAISIKPNTPASAVMPFLKEVDMILVMTVEPGFGGQKFMYDQLAKTKQIRGWLDAVNPECLIEVDGGVDRYTCPICKEHGVDVMVCGSAYFKAEDKPTFVKYVQQPILINNDY